MERIYSELEGASKKCPPSPMLDFKQLKKDREFLIYALRIYSGVYPYLKTLHSTLDGWRWNIYMEGWKYAARD